MEKAKKRVKVYKKYLSPVKNKTRE